MEGRYCICFAAKEVCNKYCKCVSCSNQVEHEKERQAAIVATLERNPHAFDNKFASKVSLEKTVENRQLIPTSLAKECGRWSLRPQFCA